MLQNLFLNIDAGTIDWSRAQFALTAIYHWLFVPLTLGLAVIMGIVETKYYQTKDDFWKEAAKFWQKLFGINFAMGVATGIILEFEFGTNWSNYSWFVGDIFGAPLAVEGIVAFFMESTFVAVMYFGWKKVSPGFHLASTWLTGLGATISAWWILVANAWMQYPVGCAFNPDTMRNEMVSFAEVALSPFAISKFCHTITSSWIIGAIFCVGVCCWYLLKKRHTKLAIESMKIGAGVGLVAALLAGATGHKSGMDVANVQPMKLAAMEALYDGGTAQGLKLVEGIEVPYGLSIMATNDPQGFVPGINDILNGYTTPDGRVEPSVDEKIERGKKAIEALAAYRKAKAEGEDASIYLAELNENMKYFGYGYIKDKNDVVPPVWINFWSFRIMVGVGCLFILFFAVILAVTYKFPKRLFEKRDITTLPAWHYWVAIALIPLAYIGSECGWLVAEFGRQPWTIQDMLPTWASVSDLQASNVAITFCLFLILFTTMLAVEINILLKQIKKGPEL
ncbi:cytochrome ubiquinol oxidase subunit I [Prevotella sp. P6B4]|uniref:cytochrome ubiquinol oxidase subunit I n=1 Tax=Prevotella sp. P6B4 TaxID=1410614 RepID=UPI0004918288|nr:cytochrome ubiquinol oxidase subunit I [Prevotella sp. P6B4]